MDNWDKYKTSLEYLENGNTTLFYKKEIFHESIGQLKNEGIEIFKLNASHWKSEQDFHEEICRVMNFPGYYGNNLNALNDCISDYSGKKIAIAIEDFNSFKNENEYVADTILRIFQNNCWKSLLFDGFVIVLLQTNNGKIEFNNWEELCPMWNRKEWLNKDHGI